MSTAAERSHKRCWWRAARKLIQAHQAEFWEYYSTERLADEADQEAALEVSEEEKVA